LTLAFVLLVPALCCAQTMYKWVDEKGVTHFSESPPPDEKTEKKAIKVTPKVTPAGNPGAYDPNAWKTRDAEARKRQVDRGKAEVADAKDKEKRQEACNRARSRLSSLQNTQVFYKDNPDGTRSFMDDKTRDAEMARAQEAIREYCN
jgi:hypothetical protein